MFVKVVKNYEDLMTFRVADNSTIALSRRCGNYLLDICGDGEDDISASMILGREFDFYVEMIYGGKVKRMTETFFSFTDGEEARLVLNGYLEDVLKDYDILGQGCTYENIKK